MNAHALAEAVAWISQRLPHAQLGDLAAILMIGAAGHRVALPELAAKLGVPEPWVDAFVARHAGYHEGNAPVVAVTSAEAGQMVELSSVGRNLLNRFWQQSGISAPQRGSDSAGAGHALPGSDLGGY